MPEAVSLSDIVVPLLNGTSEYFSIVDGDSLGDDTNPYTICMWLRFDVGFSGTQAIFSKWDTATANRSYNLTYDSTINNFIIGASFDGGNSSEFHVPFVMTQNNWVFIALRFTGTKVQLIIDSIQQFSVDFALPFNSTAPLLIGKHETDFLDGSITLLSTYNGALSDGQLSQVREVSRPQDLDNNINNVMSNFWPLYQSVQFTNFIGTLAITFNDCVNLIYVAGCLPARKIIFDTFLGDVVSICNVCYQFECVTYDGAIADDTIDGVYSDCETCWTSSSSSSCSSSSM